MTRWAIVQIYVVKIYTNLQQVYEYQFKAYNANEARIHALNAFGENRLIDEEIRKIEVIDLNLKVF